MTNEFDTSAAARRLAAELRSAALPLAPASLRDRVASILEETPMAGRSRARSLPVRWVVAAALTVSAVVAFGAFYSVSSHPAPLVGPSGSPAAASASLPATVDGQPVLTVSEVLAGRAAGGLRTQPVVVAGYWSYLRIVSACAPTLDQPGELELYCQDGRYGITERNELIAPDALGPATASHGPALTPYVGQLGYSSELFALPELDGKPFPPVPIVVVGHFDDSRAAECRPAFRRLCEDRLVLDRIVQFDPRAVARPSSTPVGSAIDGAPVLSVSRVLSQRAAGGLVKQRVVVSGFWSDATVGHSCAAPPEQTGELEIYCHDGEYGITERDEPIEVVDVRGYTTVATGPALTPYVDQTVARAIELFNLPIINGQRYPPVPIVVAGHFDDPRAAKCRSSARKLCEDRLVIDEILQFDPLSVPTPAPTPSPTPFPFDNPPPALFETDRCSDGHPVSFTGWRTLRSLGIDIASPDETAYIVVTADAIPIGDWFDDPNDHTHYRVWGQRVCYAYEKDRGAIGFTAIPGTLFREYPNGSRQPTTGP